MCLDTIKEGKLPKWGIGYKVFNFQMRPPMMLGDIIYEIGKVYTDSKNTKIGWGVQYLTGYHIFNTFESANRYAIVTNHAFDDKIVKVRFSKVVAHGTQAHYKKIYDDIVVARTMTLLKEVKMEEIKC